MLFELAGDCEVVEWLMLTLAAVDAGWWKYRDQNMRGTEQS